MLSANEQERYERQMLMPSIGVDGQERLKKATVCVAGAGGLGSAVLTYLSSAGLGTIIICDDGKVELSNFNRQFMYRQLDIGEQKARSAKGYLDDRNSTIATIAKTDTITAETVDALVGQSDIIIDCLDDYETRYVLTACAIRQHIPIIFGSVHGYEGKVSFFAPPETPCFYCLFQESIKLKTIPILGATAGVIGSLQVIECIKYISGTDDVLKNRLLIFDGEKMSFVLMKVKRDPCCSLCKELVQTSV